MFSKFDIKFRATPSASSAQNRSESPKSTASSPPEINELLDKFNIDKSRYKKLDQGDAKQLEEALTCFAGEHIVSKDENGKSQTTFQCFDDYKNGTCSLDSSIRAAFAMGSLDWVKAADTMMRLGLADPNQRDENHESLLEQVVKQPKVHTRFPGTVLLSPEARLKILLEHGADPIATLEGHLEKTLQLDFSDYHAKLEELGIDIIRAMKPPIYMAFEMGQSAMIAPLLESTISKYMDNHDIGKAKTANKDALAYQKKSRAEEAQRTSNDALIYAVENNDVELTLEILNIGEKHLTMISHHLKFPLLHAALDGWLGSALGIHGAKVTFRSKIIKSVLQQAFNGKIDVNAKDQNGKTPLQLCLGLLLEEKTVGPVHIRWHADLPDVQEIMLRLIKAGADVNATNSEGETLLEEYQNQRLYRPDAQVIQMLSGAVTKQ